MPNQPARKGSARTQPAPSQAAANQRPAAKQSAACPVCGQNTQPIPTGGACPACGSSSQMSDMLNIDTFRSTKATAVTARPPAPKLTFGVWLKGTALSMLVWGGGVGLVFALGFGLLSQLLISQEDFNGFTSGATSGLVLGIIIGCTWGSARKEYVGILGDVLIGMIVGGACTSIQYMYESIFISIPDESMYIFVIMGIFCGAAAGFLSVWLKHYLDKR